MGRRTKSSAIIDGLLKFVVAGGTLGVGLVAPNALQALDKPLQKFFTAMDEKARDREYNRLIRDMKSRGLISYNSGDYSHGIQLTKKGRKRAEQASIDALEIARQDKWDNKWRITMFDIPEKHKIGRNTLTMKLKELGCIQLQRSVWLHPYPFRDILIPIAVHYGVEHYVTYIETSHIENDEPLKEHFKL